jgi:hypothetical protein
MVQGHQRVYVLLFIHRIVLAWEGNHRCAEASI